MLKSVLKQQKSSKPLFEKMDMLYIFSTFRRVVGLEEPKYGQKFKKKIEFLYYEKFFDFNTNVIIIFDVLPNGASALSEIFLHCSICMKLTLYEGKISP